MLRGAGRGSANVGAVLVEAGLSVVCSLTGALGTSSCFPMLVAVKSDILAKGPRYQLWNPGSEDTECDTLLTTTER